jgi:hypothetical protein
MIIPHLSLIRLSRSSTSSSSSNITNLEERPWTLIGEAKDHLLAELEQLYWIGIERELISVLLTLRTWQSRELSTVTLADESDSFVHGFDTFIDQVSERSREFADQFGKFKDLGQVNPDFGENYIRAMDLNLREVTTEVTSSRLKAEIRQAIEDQESESTIRRRARMLLQAVGFLDIEKLVEHRPPLDSLSFCKRPAIPQLQLHTYSKTGIPVLTPLRCSSCGSIIRASMYCQKPTGVLNQPLQHICEDCYREKFLGNTGFVKTYKHCILNEIINSRVSRKICMCEDVPHYDPQGKSLVLFPVGKNDKHRKADKPGMVKCGLFHLGEVVAEAKYDAMRTITTQKKLKSKRTLADEKRDNQQANMTKRKQARRPRIITQQSQHAPDRDVTTGTAVAVKEAEADEDIPVFLRRYTEKYPFGNVHMALRIGPLVVENGVAQ